MALSISIKLELAVSDTGSYICICYQLQFYTSSKYCMCRYYLLLAALYRVAKLLIAVIPHFTDRIQITKLPVGPPSKLLVDLP
jgi:hypothetical protein